MRKINPVTILNDATYATPLGFEEVSDLSTVSSLTPPTGSQTALIQAEGEDVRWKGDGSDPTGTEGMLLLSGESIRYSGDLGALRFIEATAGASLNVSYYG